MSTNDTSNVGNAVMVPVPRLHDVNANLHRVSERTRTKSRPANTAKAYDGKQMELIQYLDHVWAHDAYCRILDRDKVYRFIFYQCAREKRPSRRGTRVTQQFDVSDYEQVMQKYDNHNSNTHNHEIQFEQPFIQPKKGLQFQALRQYKAVIKEFFVQQVELGHQSRGWEHIWTARCDVLTNIVRSRAAQQKLVNYEEKVTHTLSPFTIVTRYPEIENKLYHQGMGNTRSAVTQLRNRYVLTHTTCGILRFESLEKACLSDFLCAYIKKEDDVHPLLVMITQVFTGKILTCGFIFMTVICMNY